MRYAVLSDLHANHDALTRVLADAERQGAEQIVCLGDIVGYGPLPQETLDLARAACAIVVAGNHDDAVSGRGDASAFIDLAGEAVGRHRAALSSDSLAWLKALPYQAAFDGALAVHGDWTDPPRFAYVEEPTDAAANFAACDTQLLFVGHTHIPGLFLIGASGTVYRAAPQDFTLEDGKRYIVNPGSVGYPREANGRCSSSYVIYDSNERTITFRMLPFSVASVMQRGEIPRRPRTAVLFGLITLVIASLTAVGIRWLRQPAPVTATEPAVVTAERPTAAPVLATRQLALPPGVAAVRANLELDKDSAPVLLRIAFLDKNDCPLATEPLTVKRSSFKEIKIPPTAVRAIFDVMAVKEGDRPSLRTFAPALSTK